MHQQCILLHHVKINPDATFRSARWGKRPIQIACEQKCLKLVDVLLEAGVDVSEDDILASALEGDCSIENNAQLLKILLNAGANPNARFSKPTRSPLSTAAAKADAVAVSILLDAGASVNPVFGEPPLASALTSSVSNCEILFCVVLSLLKAGADVHATLRDMDYDDAFSDEDCSSDDDYSTMLEIAADYKRSLDIIKILIEYKASITPGFVMTVFDSEYLEQVRFCLDQGAQIPKYLSSTTAEIA
ncbi:hypothetical protein N7492_007218 [Penicillium capsulatum]|uniref:Ankyrin n=1 Tax=Penicillium capsulatum TaxID=69766 RepID=A0A9W9I1W6_9EURO|nr:hypothetical protein N7492_007218 [Penicillium capsulatum]KAJ6117056.1 hypothetical protein N7512_006781 [Penicillium capsulatum]